jgi:DUF1680 family protein
MERVLYNTILGAKPLLPDGTSFYYSDYNPQARKTYHRDKWPCCSGTFPQITADYGISSYFRGPNAIYVNLYVPSRLAWSQGDTRCTLTQLTNFPAENASELEFTSARPENFTLHLRIPEWSGAKTVVSVNGKRIPQELRPGLFAAIQRTWKGGDRITVEFDMPVQLETVDAQHLDLVAPLHGPVTLFGIGEFPQQIRRADLLSLQQDGRNWKLETGGRSVTFKSFPEIGDETYRLYHHVT